jgi:hypothetical protein
LHRHEEAQQAQANNQQRRQRKIHQHLARVEEFRLLSRLVSLLVYRSGRLRDTSETRYRRIPSPKKNLPTPRNRTNAIGRVQNKHKVSTSKPRISRIPESCSRRSTGGSNRITSG